MNASTVRLPKRPLGKTGLKVSVLGFGASTLGGVFEVLHVFVCFFHAFFIVLSFAFRSFMVFFSNQSDRMMDGWVSGINIWWTDVDDG